MGLSLIAGCDQVMALINPAKDPDALVAPAQDALKKGDLPAALEEYKKIAAENEKVAEAKVGHAYLQMLAGDLDGADKSLSDALAIEGLEDKVKGQINLRRALVALKKGDLTNVQKYGEASGLPAGKVMAAEVYLSDAEAASAMPLLEQASSEGEGAVKDAAKAYLEYLQDTESVRPQLAEATALWALGKREEACEAAEALLPNLPAEFPQRNDLLLLWAGRAASAGRPSVAQALLDDMGGAPENQAWRVSATRALVAVANEDYETARSLFAALSEGAPVDGLADARATAAAISKDQAFAKEIAAGVKSNAVARGLLQAGDTSAAKEAADSGAFSRYLESQ
jgi:hypothetical protein